jgi:hypothetical protein
MPIDIATQRLGYRTTALNAFYWVIEPNRATLAANGRALDLDSIRDVLWYLMDDELESTALKYRVMFTTLPTAHAKCFGIEHGHRRQVFSEENSSYIRCLYHVTFLMLMASSQSLLILANNSL